MANSSFGPPASRSDRRYTTRSKQSVDRRTEFQRDRDRILYSSSLRRLALITQVVSPDEGHTFHNRLTHVIKVAQVGRQLAERLRIEYPEHTETLGGIEPTVVETAALTHDLGHPPFGHLAEEALDHLATKVGFREGFEGNAQSFRVITKLEIRDADGRHPGLNLTRASLNAVLKYPWQRGASGKHSEKWGAYDSEVQDFDFARVGCKAAAGKQCIEAQIMDWADDIAYSTHDMDDFYRANKVPLWKLVDDEDERGDLVEHMVKRGVITESERATYTDLAGKLFGASPVSEPFDGTRGTIGAMRVFVSALISEFEAGTSLSSEGVVVKDECLAKVKVLKELVWRYVIHNPALATQQYGQRKIIEELFEIFQSAAACERDHKLFPIEYRDLLRDAGSRHRTVLDYIAGLTEPQAVRLHHRLTGHNLGAVALA